MSVVGVLLMAALAGAAQWALVRWLRYDRARQRERADS